MKDSAKYICNGHLEQTIQHIDEECSLLNSNNLNLQDVANFTVTLYTLRKKYI